MFHLERKPSPAPARHPGTKRWLRSTMMRWLTRPRQQAIEKYLWNGKEDGTPTMIHKENVAQ
ncbi:hypothetical protein LNP74_28060 [Klebsiella pneumoniae subsp. pneumoniae]|nr:hypothetical protein [Klebsiella pneumoniae subsp. pneumoniae]